jgi:hypothetical protein
MSIVLMVFLSDDAEEEGGPLGLEIGRKGRDAM